VDVEFKDGSNRTVWKKTRAEADKFAAQEYQRAGVNRADVFSTTKAYEADYASAIKALGYTKTVKGKDTYKIVNSETGEVLKNQPMYYGDRTVVGKAVQRVTNWPNARVAKRRIKQLEQVSKAKSEPLILDDQIQVLNWIKETGEIPLTAPKQVHEAEAGQLGAKDVTKTKHEWRKRHNFAKNLQGDSNAVTFDTWGMRAFGWYHKNPDGTPKMIKDKKTGKKGPKNYEIRQWMYNQFEVTVRELATKLDMTPREVQAAMWSATRAEWLMKGWIDMKGEHHNSYEPYIIYKLVAKGSFRRWAQVNMKKLAESHPEVLAEMVKHNIPPEILNTHISYKPKVEPDIKSFLKACFRGK
jgi:hypothetical protein